MMIEHTIMVVDDEPQIREVFATNFSVNGYKVITAESGKQALEIMRESPCLVLFLDLNMPNMDGLELCRQIKEGWPMAICYAVTGYVSLFELTDCRDAGFEDYFTKPVELSDLRDAADHALTKLHRWKQPTI